MAQLRKQRLRFAAQRGDLQAVTSILNANNHQTASTDQLATLAAPHADDGNATFLHYVCAGLPTKGLIAAIVGWPEGIRPSQRDAERAAVLATVLEAHPRLALSAATANTRGLTPIHLCVHTASIATLRVLVDALHRVANPYLVALILSIALPNTDGMTSFDLAVASQQWEAASLLTSAAPLSSAGTRAAVEVASPSGGILGSSNAFLKGKQSVTNLHGEGFREMVAGTVGGAFNRMWDAVGGRAGEGNLVSKHKETVQAMGSRQILTTAAAVDDRAGGASSSAALQLHPSSTAALTTVALDNLYAVSQRREEQVLRISGVLDVSEAEAIHLLQRHRWDERAAAADWFRRHNHSSSSATLAALQGETIREGAEFDSNNHAYVVRGNNTPSPNSPTTMPCIVCFEEPPSLLPLPTDHSTSSSSQQQQQWRSSLAGSSAMPCRSDHYVCDDCWRGILRAAIDEGQPRNAVCPGPRCGLPLPLSAARQLLPNNAFDRHQRLVAEQYVTANPNLRFCPAPGCTRVLQKVSNTSSSGSDAAAFPAMPSVDPAAAGPSSSSSSATMTTTRCGVDAQCACEHSFCWHCSAEAHEPATCSQVTSWKEELQRLRALAPVLDQKWLRANARQCPNCGVHIERNGGCLHITCSRCSAHFCWECGRPWNQHSAASGGFYLCLFAAQQAEANDRAAADGGSSSSNSNSNSGNSNVVQSNTDQGTSGWIFRTALQSVHGNLSSMAAKATLQRALQQHLAHECDTRSLKLTAEYMSRILRTLCDSGSAQQSSLAVAVVNVESIGVSLSEAATMHEREWSLLVNAACQSSLGDWMQKTGNAAGSGSGSAASSGSGGGGSNRASSSHHRINVKQLANVLCEGHRALQNAAAVLNALPGGARRRYLLELCDAVEASMQKLEVLLLQLPCRSEAVACAQVLNDSSGGNARRRNGPGGLLSPIKWVMKAWQRVPEPPKENWLPIVDKHSLLLQTHYIVAVAQLWSEGMWKEFEVLVQRLGALKHAGRSGLFAD